ncbi:hypothetical protein D3C78_1506950 [compost metagenome]
MLAGPGVEGLAGGVGIVGLARALEVVEYGARARAGLSDARHRRLPAATPPETEAEQGGAGQDQGAEFPAPECFAVGAGIDR